MEEKIKKMISEYRNKIEVMQETIDKLERILDEKGDYDYEPEEKLVDEIA